MFEFRLNQGTVLLRQAVESLIDLGDFADFNISPEALIVMSSSTTPVSEHLAILRLPESPFVSVICHKPRSFALNLRGLYLNLVNAGVYDVVTLNCDGDEDSVGFVTVNSETGAFAYSELALTDSYAVLLNLPELDAQYHAIVGIHSENFRHLIKHLHNFGRHVSVLVTDTKVKFSAASEQVVYRTELGQCIIGGVPPEHPVSLIFDLHSFSVIQNACLLSNIVWLLQADDFPALLNCPVDLIGNLMLYFDLRP